MVGFCKEAAEELAEGISAEVINLRTLLRLAGPQTIINSVMQDQPRWWWSRRAGPRAASAPELGACMNEDAFDYLDAPVERVTGADIPMPYAANLEKLALPQVSDIVRVASASATGSESEEKETREGRVARASSHLRT